MNGFVFQAFIYLLAAVVSVLVAKRLGLGSVLGYLIAGVLIGRCSPCRQRDRGPAALCRGFGVVMMLFLVGLELQPRVFGNAPAAGARKACRSSRRRRSIMAISMLLGQVWSVSLTVGFIFSLSSTAIVLQTLGEKGLLKSDGGQSSFSVLLFQDIAVIPMLALIPLLALPELSRLLQHTPAAGGHSTAGLLDGLPGWQVTIITIAAVAFVVVAGHYLSRPIFRIIAASKLREIFTAAALLLVIAIALLMTLVGLSPARHVPGWRGRNSNSARLESIEPQGPVARPLFHYRRRQHQLRAVVGKTAIVVAH